MMVLNYVGIVIASIARFLIGWLWYGMVFRDHWMKAVGPIRIEEKKEHSTFVMALSFGTTLVMSWVLAYLFALIGPMSYIDGMVYGFIISTGFIATTQGEDYIFKGKNKYLFLLNTGYNLVSAIVMGGIIAYYGM